MRATLTLNDDIAEKVRKLSEESGKSFDAVINDLLRNGIVEEPARPMARPYELEPVNLGDVIGPYDLDKANQVAADLEDQEIIRKMEIGRNM